MIKTYEGSLIAKGKKFGLVVSRFNDFISKRLLDGAVDCLKRHGADEQDIEVVWTPGSFEIPLVAQALMAKKKFDAIVALGAIIKGDTPHFEYVASELSKGISKVSIKSGIPIAFGVITAETLEQAIDRAGAKSGNKGAQAAQSAIEMAGLMGELRRK